MCIGVSTNSTHSKKQTNPNQHFRSPGNSQGMNGWMDSKADRETLDGCKTVGFLGNLGWVKCFSWDTGLYTATGAPVLDHGWNASKKIRIEDS